MDQNQQASKPEETTSSPTAPQPASSQNESKPVTTEPAKEATKPEQMSTTALSQATPPAGQTPPPAMSKKRGSYLSGKTTALILILAAVALFFLFLAITPQTPKQEPQKQAISAPTPIVQTILALEPITSTVSATATKKVDITIDSGKNGVNVVQLELAYDPTVITNVTVTPGTFFKNPVELTKSIDSKNGRISYALGISPSDKPVYGTGVLATLSFQFIPTATVSSTTISFLPKTLVGATGMNASALKSAKPLQLSVPVTPTLPKATPLQTASPSSTISK